MPASGSTWLGIARRLLDVRGEQRRDHALERRLADEQLERDAADRVDVAARIRRLALALLGRHVLRRSEHRAGARQHQALFEIAEQDLRHPEVEHLDDLAVGMIREHQVVRLEIAMHDARRRARGGAHRRSRRGRRASSRSAAVRARGAAPTATGLRRTPSSGTAGRPAAGRRRRSARCSGARADDRRGPRA